MSTTMESPVEILRSGRLAGLTVEDLADRYGTPLFVYDLGVIDRQVDALLAVLPDRAELAYAVKANPALAIVAHMGRLGLGADIASGGELATALRAGISADRIVMTGPGKREEELTAAVSAGVRAVTVESIGELGRLEQVARDAGRRQPVMLRVAMPESDGAERVRLVGAGGLGKFGMDAADLVDAARLVARSAHLDLLGLHAFGASNVLEASRLVAHVAATGRMASPIENQMPTALSGISASSGQNSPPRL